MDEITVGTEFVSKNALKLACHALGVRNNFQFKPLGSSQSRYNIACRAEGCPWRLWASPVSRTTIWRVKTMNSEHTCFGINDKGNKQLTAAFLSHKIMEKVQQQPDYRPFNIVQDLEREDGVLVTYQKAWRAKELAFIAINGDYQESYQYLPKYCESIVASNPGTIALLETTDESKFRRLFISYGASGAGLIHCRPLLGLDGTHLKSKYLGSHSSILNSDGVGILLAATGIDAEGSLYPVAYAVVSAENDENWAWFLTNLHDIVSDRCPTWLEVNNAPEERLTFLSDRQKGLVEGVHDIFPNSAHGYCLKHLEANFKKKFTNKELHSLLWQAAAAFDEATFNIVMQNMRAINPDAVKWLLDNAPPIHWAECYFPGRRFGHLTSNIAESLNAWLLQARDLPILPMLEEIRHRLMDLFEKRRQLADKMPPMIPLAPSITKKMQHVMNTYSRRYRARRCDEYIYEIIPESTSSGRTYIIDVQRRMCDCTRWQRLGYPCAHAIAVILLRNGDPQEYVAKFYTLASWRSSYSGVIMPPNFHQFDDAPLFDINKYKALLESDEGRDNDAQADSDTEFILPPSTQRPAGRPKNRRIRSENEKETRAFKCSRCPGFGHSKRTCREAI
jgi:MULE transposase domain/MuDR family transposase/SWIM zinc finger